MHGPSPTGSHGSVTSRTSPERWPNVREHFSSDAMVEKTLEVYTEVMRV